MLKVIQGPCLIYQVFTGMLEVLELTLTVLIYRDYNIVCLSETYLVARIMSFLVLEHFIVLCRNERNFSEG